MTDDLIERLARRRYNAERDSLFDPEWSDVTGYVRDALIQDVRDTISALRAEGFAVVPVEATPEMVEELYGSYLGPTSHEARVKCYRAMVAAGRVDGGGE